MPIVVVRGDEIMGYADERGNRIIGKPKASRNSVVEFMASNCTLIFSDDFTLDGVVSFRNSGSNVRMGHRSSFRGRMSLGVNSTIQMGDSIYCGPDAELTVAEGQSIILGNDLLISRSVRIRADDSHPIFDRATGRRINHSKSVIVGDHVWLGQEVMLLPGSRLLTGSVLGARAVLSKTCDAPEYSILVGVPARVVRKNIHWVRKHVQRDQIEDLLGSDLRFPNEIDPEPVRIEERYNFNLSRLIMTLSTTARRFVGKLIIKN